MSKVDTAAELDVQVKDTVEYRLKRVELMCGYCVGQVKMVYDDDSFWACGGDSGSDTRKVILTDNEWLVKVQQEVFVSRSACGAGFTFITNKGRVFEFTSHLSSKRKSEMVTAEALPGHEIIGLVIRGGVFSGTCQQQAPPATLDTQALLATKQWFAVGQQMPKRDGLVEWQHFFDKAEAQAAWRETKGSKADGAVFLDVRELKHLAKCGNKDAVEACFDDAFDAGLAIPRKGKDEPILERLIKLMRLIGQPEDVGAFVVTITLLGGAFYMDLECCMLQGLVLSVVTQTNQTEVSDAVLANRYAGMATSWLGGASTAELKYAAIFAFLAVRVAEALLYVSNVWVHHTHCDNKNLFMAQRIFKHVLGLDQAFFDTHSMGEVKGGMQVHALSNIVSWRVPYVFNEGMQLVMTAAFMLTVHRRLALLCLSGYALLKFGVMDKLSHIRRVLHRIDRKLDINIGQIKEDALAHLESVKLFGKEDFHQAVYAEANARSGFLLKDIVAWRCVDEFMHHIIMGAITSVMLWNSVRLFEDAAHADELGNLNAGTMTAFYMLFERFRHRFNCVRHGWDEIVREFSDVDRFLALMAAKTSLEDRPHKVSLDPAQVRGEIEFKDVDFEYPSRPGEKVLRKLNLKIKPNQITAVVGDSGSGKSTLTKLLLRSYDPQHGSVTLDGVDLKDLPTEELRSHIGVVNQNPQLFNTSLADNIGYGAQGSPAPAEVFDRVVEASKLSNCHDFITGFRGGFDTFAGSSGSQLSGGQRQRIAIARAAVRDPKILILDEATSALDAENEAVVQDAMEKLMAGRTILVIAHRLSTIKNAAEILCMSKEGKVVERGTHDELMAAHGTYRRLVELQLMPQEQEDAKAQPSAVTSDAVPSPA